MYYYTQGSMSRAESVASSAVKTAFDLKAKMLIVLTESGATARLVAKYRPNMPLLVITDNAQNARQSDAYVHGSKSMVIENMTGTETILTDAIASMVAKGKLAAGDTVVSVYGQQEGHSGATSTVRVITV